MNTTVAANTVIHITVVGKTVGKHCNQNDPVENTVEHNTVVENQVEPNTVMENQVGQNTF